MTLYQILCLIGVPSLLGGAAAYVQTRFKRQRDEMHAVKLGIQALLRAQMISDYNHYMEKGYAPIYARENFENCWKQYHSMGKNGVMDDIHDRFMDLPTAVQANKERGKIDEKG